MNEDKKIQKKKGVSKYKQKNGIKKGFVVGVVIMMVDS